ncbi:hypothetical protein BIW11_13924 [Tropilaelaps mercedesae]|uniref:Kynurenine formamidase-like n=1 Tax=Tropilaelaps mercedesae TaxID=418985 RepID=A0A1V9WZQ8_9ACAR|nr:hypothetical protein BIW11_13924 [Tropilaelaps mercedesae]
MRLLIVVALAIPTLKGERGSAKNAAQRSQAQDCHRDLSLSPEPETTLFPWENPTNENLIDLSWTYDTSTIYWEDNETFELNISTSVVKNRGYLLSIRDLQLWENGHGPLPNNSLLIIRTGHHMLWGNREGYFGRLNGNSTRVFPSMGAKTARWLVHSREIVGVGIDSPSIDGYPSLMGHRAFAKKNVYILENLGSHIDQAPKLGTFAFVMPMKIAGASGGPVRVLLRVPHSRPKPTTPNPAIS